IKTQPFDRMQKEIEIAIPPERIEDKQYILQQGIKTLRLKPQQVKGFKSRKRSIDARSKQVVYRARVIYYIDELPLPDIYENHFQSVQMATPVIIVGAGPAGLFAAIRCIERGLKPIVIERGKKVQDRRRDLA